eukprot:m.34460 g.34460  ORF g.34460 m.34460 type:complete len:176 (+) comp5220_c0_seq2:3-530(+)
MVSRLNHLDRVLPGLFIGDLQSSEPQRLREHGITHVLSVCEGPAGTLSSVTYLHYFAMDDEKTKLSIHFEDAVGWIHRARLAGGVVLVHCMAGMSRSATVVLAYMMACTAHPLMPCFVALQEARPCVHPNTAFWAQLEKYEKKGLKAARKMHPPIAGDHEAVAALLPRPRAPPAK